VLKADLPTRVADEAAAVVTALLLEALVATALLLRPPVETGLLPPMQPPHLVSRRAGQLGVTRARYLAAGAAA
jgi:hypothetical protein